MKQKKKKSLFPLVFSILTALALLIGLLDVFAYLKYYRSGKFKSMMHPAEKIDMTDPDGNTNYGRIYYSPIDEEHIVEYEQDSGCGYIDNEVLVVANDGVSREQIAELAAKYDAEIVGEIGVSRDYQLKLSETPDNINTVVDQLASETIIDSATPNYVSGMSADSGDIGYFCYGKEWANELRADSHDDETDRSWGFRLINTPKAWLAIQENMDVVDPVNVGVCDGGMSDSHSDVRFEEFFYENGVYGKTTKGSILSADARGHGTHVSGTFAADTYDDNGIGGVYPYGHGRLYGVSVSNAAETIRSFGDYDFFNSCMCEKVAFAELIVRNVKVINFSMGYNYEANKFTNKLTQKVDYDGLAAFFSNEDNHIETAKCASVLGDFYNRMLKKGYDFVLVASAGNDSSDETGHLESKYNSPLTLIERSEYPDVYDRIIVVGALDRKQGILECSNTGNRVDIFAPGQMIYSAYILDGYHSMSGTSMAAPHVSGVAAMMWTVNKSLSGAQIKSIILNNPSTEVTDVNMVDAYNSVAEALKTAGTSVNIDLSNGAVIGDVIAKQIVLKTIESAEVTLTNKDTGYSYSGTTDKDGFYEIAVPNGKYDMRVSAEGYNDFTTPEKRPVSVDANRIVYVDTIRLNKSEESSSKDKDEAAAETTADASLKTVKEKPKAGKIYTGEDIKKFLPDKFGKFDIGIGLDKIRAWTYYEGHYYAIFDYAMSAKVMTLATKQDPNVHLVTITSEEEQQLIEELMLYGERDVYYTGGLVDEDGDVYTVNSEDTDYTHWYTDCPENYGKEDKDDIIAIYRGAVDEPKSSPDYGYWFDLNEDEYNLFDFADFNVEGATRGIIIEWDTPILETDN